MESSSTALDWPTEDNYEQPMLNNNVQRPTLHNMNKHHHNSSSSPQLEHNLSLKSSGSRDQQIFRRALSRSSTGSTPPPSNNSTSFSTRGSSSANMNVSSTTNNNNNNNGRGSIIFESYESSVNNNHNRYDGGGRNHNSISIPSRDLGNGNNRSILDNIAESVAQRQQTSQLNAAQLRALNNSNLTNTPTSLQQQNQSLSKSFGTPSPSNTSHQQLSSPPQSTNTKPRSTVNKLVSMFSLKHEKELAKKNSSASSIPLSSEEKRIAANSVKSRASGWENRARSEDKKSIGNVGGGLQYIKQTVAGVQFQSPIITNTNRQQSQQTQRNQGGSVTNSSTQSQSTYSTTGPYIQSNHNPNSTNFNPPQHHHNQQQQVQQPLSISPSRSNTQSSVTEYTGESSNYNPTGWPGTIDRRGRMYAMESRSYSESENESTSSPLKNMNQRRDEYPVQNYRDNEVQHHQHQQQKETWLNGDNISIYDGESAVVPSSHGPIDLDGSYNANVENERRSGPIDLDEAYENRFDNNKSAADVQLNAALQLRNNTSQRQTPGSARQATNTTSMNSQTTRERFQPSQTTNAMLEQDAKLHGIDLTGSEHRVRASGRRLPSPKIFQEEVSFDTDPPHDTAYNNNNSYSSQQQQRNQPQTLSEEALRYKDSQSAPPREGGNLMLRGYRGFIDKTKDVPNLMDDLESEASTNIFSTADVRRHANMGLTLPSISQQQQRRKLSSSRQTSLGSIVSSNIESESDVFDGVVQEEPFGLSEEQYSLWERSQDAPQAIQQHASYNFEDEEQVNFSTQYNPFTTTSKPLHNSRAQSNSFLDPSLDISAVTRGSADISSRHLHHDMDGEDEDFESLPDLSIYYVQPEMVRKMVRAFRKLCTSQMEFSSSEESMLYDFENLVDTKKAFALFEMRSRIMETDIDRGLERRGGTNVVDDIVLTPYFQAASRVRDAVIVSKAWRDGATPKDVTTAHLLTRRSAKAHFVKRPIYRIRRPGMSYYDSNVPQYWLEEVKWLDDTDFQQMRCQSLGAGTMSGFEMFTIGDCQSILLRLTSENCTQLRRELKVAMLHSIEAEELMQEEIDLDGDENIVLEAEQLFRDATIEVKRLSVKLVLADKAFALVRNRMEKLVETIESLLVQIEDEDDDGGESISSSVQSECDDFDEDNSYASQDSEDKEELVQRAKRAELSAEVAVRETLLAKQQAEQMQFDKQREIDELKNKLVEMETKSQLMAAENRKLYYGGGTQVSASFFLDDAKSFLGSTFDKDAEETRKQKLKSKFKERRKPKVVVEATPQRKTAVRDEEIYSHHDFYTRALNAVNKNDTHY